MPDKKIEFNTSLIRRLRVIMFSVTIFIVAGFIGSYFASLPYLQGLQEMNTSNLILASTSRAIDGLDSSDNEIEKLGTGKRVKEINFSFNTNQKLVRDNLEMARTYSLERPELVEFYRIANDAILDYEITINGLFHRLTTIPTPLLKENREELNAELLVAKQFINDARESLRRASIEVKESSERTFVSIFTHRYRPLVVGVTASILFLTFVIVFGFSIIKRLRRSLYNLTTATENIAQGDLDYQAPIISYDEVGNLTNAFNKMVVSLKKNQTQVKLTADKIARLQSVTSSFSEALTSDQVYDVIVQQGLEAMNASSIAIATRSEDRKELELKRARGFSQDLISHLPPRFSLARNSPLSDVVRYGQAVFIETRAELLKIYPQLETNINWNVEASAVVPLSVGSEVLGGVSFNFEEKRTFSPQEKQFMLSLARQCAQALHRSQLFDDARKAIQVRDEFLSIASHELKTPLTPLKLQLQGLARQVQKGTFQSLPPERLNKIMENSDKQITRLSTLIEDLLDVSRISSGKLNLNREEFSLNEMIDEVVKHYSEQLKSLQCEIRVHCDEEISGMMDKVRIEQVLINFLTNAGKYAPGKPIHIELHRSGAMAVIAVRDEGPGIAPDDQVRIFDRFERIKARDNIGGLGLGLYISKQIVEAHGGQISVKSEIGHGATFIAKLPLLPPHAENHIQSELLGGAQ